MIFINQIIHTPFELPSLLVMAASDVSSLMEHYEEDSNQQLSDLILEDIARSNCQKWRNPPLRLGLPNILVKDIERSTAEEDEFLSRVEPLTRSSS